jgi:zinc protease
VSHPFWVARATAVILFAFALAGVAADGIAAAGGARTPEREPVQMRTLSNGLTVVVVEDDTVAVVQTDVWFRYGAADEAPGKAGLAHALARMLCRGTPALSAAGFDDVVSRLGARATVTTGNDYTRFSLAVPADRLDLALRIQADRMTSASFTDADWDDEKRTLVSDHDAALDAPLDRLYRDVCHAATPTPICTTAALGESGDIARVTADDIREIARERYVAPNATLVIAGNVRPEEAFARADDAFRTLPKPDLAGHSSVVPQYAHDAHVASTGATPYDVIDVAYPAPGIDDPRAGAFAVLDAMLDDKRSDVSRALLDTGFAAEFSTRYDSNVRGGLYHVFITVAHNHANAPVASAFLAAIARTRARAVSPELVRAAKAMLVRRAEDAGDSIDGIAAYVGYARAVENVAGPGVDVQRMVAASVDDVTAAARVYLEEPAATGVLASRAHRDDDLPRPPLASVTDDFSRRVPLGAVVEAAWVKAAIAKPVALQSGVRPQAFVLPGGVRVLVYPVVANPTVFISGTVETSPSFDGRGREGLGEMVSRLLSAGSAKYDADARRNVARTLGARFQFGLTFRAHGRATDLRALLDVLADALAAPAFGIDDVERERADARDRLRYPDPGDAAREALERVLRRPGDPPLRAPSDASLRAISIENLRSYVRQFVRPSATTLAIVGDVDTDAVRADVAATFGDWTVDSPAPSMQPLRFEGTDPQEAGEEASGDRVVARFALPATARASHDYYALAVLAEILAARRYPPNSVALEADRFRGRLLLRLTVERAQLPRAVDMLRRELGGLRAGPVGPSELLRAKSRAVADPLVAEQATGTIAERVREIGLDRLPLDVETKLPKRFSAIRAEDVVRVARTYLQPSALIEVDEDVDKGPYP